MPAMTPEERNARKRELAFKKQYDAYNHRLSATVHIFIHAKQHGWTHDKMLEQMKLRVHDAGVKLPSYYVGKLSGAWDALMQMAYHNDLVFCYEHPKTGVITPVTILSNAGLSSQIDTNTGAYYWRKDLNGEYRQFSKKRDDELVSSDREGQNE